jgi:hypothetical protein
MQRRHFEGWLPDVARACIVTAFYIAGIAIGLSQSMLYGGGFAGAFPLLLTLFLGPWAAAWITSKVLPSDGCRLVLRLAAGTYAGVILYLIDGNVLSAVVSALIPQSLPATPGARFIARYDAYLALIPIPIFLPAAALAFLRWKRRTSIQVQSAKGTQ